MLFVMLHVRHVAEIWTYNMYVLYWFSNELPYEELHTNAW